MSKNKPGRGQVELEEYIFTRPETAKLLGISTNALRMRMRKGRCDLDYRFDGTQFLFKRLPRDRLISMMPDLSKTTHEKALYDYNKKVQKKYNRGATHKGKAKYPNEVFKLQNEMKIMNHIQGKFKSESHRKEFEKLNEEGLKIAQENLRKKEATLKRLAKRFATIQVVASDNKVDMVRMIPFVKKLRAKTRKEKGKFIKEFFKKEALNPDNLFRKSMFDENFTEEDWQEEKEYLGKMDAE